MPPDAGTQVPVDVMAHAEKATSADLERLLRGCAIAEREPPDDAGDPGVFVRLGKHRVGVGERVGRLDDDGRIDAGGSKLRRKVVRVSVAPALRLR